MNDDRQDESGGPGGVAIGALVCFLICCAILVGDIVNIANTPLGPEGDPDATDGRWKAMFGCFPVFLLTVGSGLVLPVAFGLRGRRLGMAIAAVLAVSLVLATVVQELVA